MIDWAKTPTFRLPTQQAQEDWERRLRADVIRDGRASRRVGIPVTACPNFTDPDMGVYWRNGWHWEDEEIRALTARGPGPPKQRRRQRHAK